MDTSPVLDPIAHYQRERDSLFSLAYRLLGSAAEAEDVLQDAYLRWHGVDHGAVRRPGAFLNRMVKRLALNVLASADRRRVDQGGACPAEPEAPDEDTDPWARQERAARLSAGIARLLERLSPAERAVFLLRECFGFSYREIARLLGKSEDNCRQIDSRARRRLREPAPDGAVESAPHRELLERFVRAAREGEVDALVDRLVADAREGALRRPSLHPSRPRRRRSRVTLDIG